ncbi:Hypothetical predicted protein [Marmota monax]|uniref:Uncharacterized protein n=1 Tax=Marmota monax TaxID=9995 RepID=A0A5E4BB37_MARMO|nr:Hypothetical predicted protein [Marmota monax]
MNQRSRCAKEKAKASLWLGSPTSTHAEVGVPLQRGPEGGPLGGNQASEDSARFRGSVPRCRHGLVIESATVSGQKLKEEPEPAAAWSAGGCAQRRAAPSWEEVEQKEPSSRTMCQSPACHLPVPTTAQQGLGISI